MQPDECSLLQSKSVGEFLSSLLRVRQLNRKSYALRTLAKKLKLSPSMLSSVIRGKRCLSKEKVLLIADCAELSEVERRHFFLLFDLEQVICHESKLCIQKSLGWIAMETSSLERP